MGDVLFEMEDWLDLFLDPDINTSFDKDCLEMCLNTDMLSYANIDWEEIHFDPYESDWMEIYRINQSYLTDFANHVGTSDSKTYGMCISIQS